MVNTNINKGDLLEFRLKRLLFFMGYIPKVGVKIKVDDESKSDDITDLDVLGMSINRDFQIISTWVDCKSGRAKTLERIVWLTGMKEIYKTSNIWFVKSRVKENIKSFARKNEIVVIDDLFLDKMESAYGIDKDDFRGCWNPTNFIGMLKNLSTLDIPKNEPYKKVSNFIEYDYWVTSKYKKVKKCITAFNYISQVNYSTLGENKEQVVRWATYELMTMFSMALMEICGELIYCNDSERKRVLFNNLRSSDISLKQRQYIIEASYSLAEQLIRSNTSMDFKLNRRDYNEMDDLPKYSEALLELINRIIDHPNHYYDVCRCMDYILFEYELNNKRIDINDVQNIFPHYDKNIIAVKSIISFVCDVVEIDRCIFREVFN
ncbi:hypothetical protein UT300012_30190 [Paraclostridium bifermentans]|uniref:hypothetical protein n=1 Tax=Paraclostridium bifermentans TaxID=1490 RepID=UPI001C10CA69|nr:hypothetical protein [Paraclostridium bifermentans]MBU5289474.1 hypothetical protein [Paraclostridium bifermentans]